MNQFTLISVRHGVIEDNGQEYANLKVLQDGIETSEGYAGLKVGKFKILDRKIADQLIKQIKVLPCKVELQTTVDFGSAEKMNIIVTGARLVGEHK